MHSASDICMRVFSAKDKNTDMLRGEVWSLTDFFVIVILCCLLQIKEPIELFNRNFVQIF